MNEELKEKDFEEMVGLLQKATTEYLMQLMIKSGKEISREEASNMLANIGMRLYLKNLRSSPTK